MTVHPLGFLLGAIVFVAVVAFFGWLILKVTGVR